MSAELIRPFKSLTRSQVALVGDKNASLGELITVLTAQGISVPPGFATSAHAYWQYVFANNIQSAMGSSIADWQAGKATLSEIGTAVRRLFLRGNWPDESAQAILGAYRELSAKDDVRDLSVAVRSSATAEDLPDASFAGQQESYLNLSSGTIREAKKVLAVMAENGLARGQNGLQVYVMCEIPSNFILATEFADCFDGFSIGSDDLTQLTLGIYRDLDELADLFDEQNEAVESMIALLIEVVRVNGCKIGICGQAPSDHPAFARFLVKAGIDFNFSEP